MRASAGRTRTAIRITLGSLHMAAKVSTSSSSHRRDVTAGFDRWFGHLSGCAATSRNRLPVRSVTSAFLPKTAVGATAEGGRFSSALDLELDRAAPVATQ